MLFKPTYQIKKQTFLILFCLLFIGSLRTASAAPGDIERIVLPANVLGANGNVGESSVSGNGRFVAFASDSSNLISGDTNDFQDIFVYDRQTGDMTRVSVSSSGEEANGQNNANPAISDNGRFIAFRSDSSNLVSGDTNGRSDVFVHDRQTGTTTRVSVASDGTEGNDGSFSASISGDGRFVAFSSGASNLVSGDNNNTNDVFVHDRQTGTTTRVSVDSSGSEGNGHSIAPNISSDGRFVAFASRANNLVSGDNNNERDVFVHDIGTGKTTRVSVASDGAEGNDESFGGSLSRDGRFITFFSLASNLVDNDTNSFYDVFVHDRQTGTTTRVSVDSDGNEVNGSSWQAEISGDGRFIVFESVASNLVPNLSGGHESIFVHDRQTGTTTLVSVNDDGVPGNRDNESPSISADGRVVAFRSLATNLVSGGANFSFSMFVHDRQQATTELVSKAGDTTELIGASYQPSMSSDGRFVAHTFTASNFIPGEEAEITFVSVYDRETGGSTPIWTHVEGELIPGFGSQPSISGDGRFVAYTLHFDQFELESRDLISIYDRQTGESTIVSTDGFNELPDGDSRYPAISSDGRFVAFYSEANNLVPNDTNELGDLFVYEIQTGNITRIVAAENGVFGDGQPSKIDISHDGRFITFDSNATNLVDISSGDFNDVFVYDRQTGIFTQVSVDSNGAPGNEHSNSSSISGDGRFVTFGSSATNLVSNDNNNNPDVFLHDRQTGETTRISESSNGVEGNGESDASSISDNGRFVTFGSSASNLVSGDSNGEYDVFVYDHLTGAMTRASEDSSGAGGNGESEGSVISDNGRFVAFVSEANNLVSNDSNGLQDVFIKELAEPTVPASCDISSGANVIEGTPRNDRLKGTPGNDIIIGYGGGDTIEGMGGNDCLIGGEGNDRLIGGEGNDILWGGEVDNTTVYERRDRDRLYGEEGNDELHGGGDHDHLEGDAGDDKLYGDDGNDGMHGDDGNDEMHGGNGKDRMEGRDGDDQMFGDAGDDTIIGRDGNDYLDGGSDKDRLEGGKGNDEMHGGAGNDRLNGDDGNDIMHGDGGDDSMQGRDGEDVMYGGSGDDDMNGGRDNDMMHGNADNDRMDGDRGNDIMQGNGGNDIVDGRDGNDQLAGNDGDDELKGGRGDDLLDGGANNDRLDGHQGTDTCLNGESLKACEL
ncbi:MAG: hypothetical protein AAF614_26765 [Chloroflexota bacterium]